MPDGPSPSPEQRARLADRLGRIYGAARTPECLRQLVALIEGRRLPSRPRAWSEEDVVLITYGDTLHRRGEAPLRTLGRFAADHLAGAFNAIHVLPFFPYSSDDGFSVIDYRAVREDLGDWTDVETLAERFRLGFDLVLNHTSARSEWFRQFLAGEPPGRDYFVCADPGADLSAVVRPRSLPLLTRVEAASGPRHVWTTFSADQVDLDFANPDVLLEFVDVLLGYVERGAGLLRLDAIAYLWKEEGTTCIHLPQTHEVVRLLRDVLDLAAPGTWLLTETNVPHAENVAYFGDGDEAHLVYQFSLPPLLLHALDAGDASHLTRWAASLAPPPPGCTFLNFTASHDGVGVRPLEGLVPGAEIGAWIDRLRARGVHVATRRAPDGGDSPYELNVTYVDALGGADDEPEALHAARFLASQTVALALRGIPAVYLHSLTGTHDWTEGVERTGRARTVNRRSWEEGELRALLAEPSGFHGQIFGELLRRVRVRVAHGAFHPDAAQRVIDLGPGLFAVRRGSGAGAVLTLANVTDRPQHVPALSAELPTGAGLRDLLAEGDPAWPAGGDALPPYGCAWLTPSRDGSAVFGDDWPYPGAEQDWDET